MRGFFIFNHLQKKLQNGLINIKSYLSKIKLLHLKI